MNTLSEISIKYNCQKFGKITSSRDIEEFLRKIWNPNTLNIHESFKIILLNQANEIVGFRTISTGGIDSVTVDLRLIFSIALGSLATSIIVAHNHPSGNLNPSMADKKITQRIKEAGEMFNIQLLDHIILTEDLYLSFAEEGLL